MSTDEMLIEISSYKYECLTHPYVFLDYNQRYKTWSLTWRKPTEFSYK